MSDTATTFKVGDRVSYRGHLATVAEVGPESHLIRYDSRPEDHYWEGDGSRYGRGFFWWVGPRHLTPLTEPQEATQSDAQPTDGQSLQGAELDALKAQIQAMQDDVATIGEHLKRTAERHEWCGEYEEHLSRLVADLSEHSAKTLESAASRVQAYKVTYTFTQEVEACDEAQARRIVEDRYDLPYEPHGWTVEEVE